MASLKMTGAAPRRLPNMRQSMPTSLRKAARRILLAAIAAFLWLAAASAPAFAQTVRIVTPDASVKSVSLADVEGTVGARYWVRSRKGSARQPVDVPGKSPSLQEVLREAGVDSDYEYLAIRRPNGGGVLRLSEEYVSTGGSPPVVFVDADGVVNLLRNSSGPDDVNVQDWIKVSSGTLSLRLTSENSLDVEIDRSKEKIVEGESATFAAEVTNGSPGERYTFRWDFEDGKSPTGQKVTRSFGSFEEPGNYSVKVTVTSTNGKGSRRTSILVGDPQKSDADSGGGGTTGSGGASGAYSGSSGGGATYGTSPAPSTTTPAPAPAPPTTSTPPVDSPEPTPPARSLGNSVAGNLLADISDPPGSAAASAVRAAREGTPQNDHDDDPAGIPTAGWALLGTLGLVTLGAGLESGRPRRMRLLRR